MPIPRLTVEDLFEAHKADLELTWVASKSAGSELLETNDANFPGMALVGHLNFIHPHRIQIIGKTEHEYLENLGENDRKKATENIFSPAQTAAVILADQITAQSELLTAAENTKTPLLTSKLPSPIIIENLQYYLTRSLAPRHTVHGVYMEVLGVGVLITGKSGVGKSELALELLSRNHRLIADDAVELVRVAPDVLVGQCPDVLSSYLEVRGLGILDIRAMFGETAIRHRKKLHLIIHMKEFGNFENSKVSRLQAEMEDRIILETSIPEILLYVAPGRNLAVLVEAAVRSYVLRVWGINPVDDFIKKQQEMIAKQD